MVTFNLLALSIFGAGVVVMCPVELALELLLIVVIPLKEVLFIIGSDRC